MPSSTVPMPVISAEGSALTRLAGSAAPCPVYINGRFLVQPLSGVQRFATETSAALLETAHEHGLPAPILLTPHPGAPPGTILPSMQAGRRGGQRWEQLELPGHAADGVLVNLGNTAPVMARRQIVVIHDAGVFRRPLAYSRAFRLWYKTLQRLLVWRRARIVTVSAFARMEVAACLRCAPERIAVVSESGAHIHAQPPDPQVLARHGLGVGLYALVVGNLAAHKNLAALGKTASRLQSRGMALAITGGLNQAVFDHARTPLPHPAIHLGRVSDAELAALYQHAACFIFPSTYEGFGLPALEAMEMGCPVVAARIPALTELCGDAALFCDPFDQDDIAAAVDRVTGEPSLRDVLRARGHARARTYTWLKTGRQLGAIIRDVQAGR